jgi:hypothetical protein
MSSNDVDSTYGAYLGASSRVARLQLEHLRLCLNSSALTSRLEGSEDIARCLRLAANAATSTIQLHFESTQTDSGLSFATDVSDTTALWDLTPLRNGVCASIAYVC